MSAQTVQTVGWIGLGAMGLGMATSLASQGHTVQAYDVYPPSLEKAVAGGCKPSSSPAEAAKGVKVLGLMVVNVVQVEDLLFSAGVAESLAEGASIIIFSTCPPSALANIQAKLDALNRGLGLVDSPVSGGSTRAAAGTLAIMVAGSPGAVQTATPTIQALTRQPEGQMSVVGEKVGAASDFKLINQVYCAIQICVTGESMAFARSLGLNPRLVYNIIRTASGDSFMFGHRVPWQWRDDAIPKSAMTIIAKDVGIVMDEARLELFPAPLCSTVEQIFTAALGNGLAREDDGKIIKMYQHFGVPSSQDEGTEEEEKEKAKELEVKSGPLPRKVLFVGLGAMGLPMAGSLVAAGIPVVGHDLAQKSLDKFAAAGGKVATSLNEEAASSDVVVIATVSAAQAEAVLFGKDGKSGIAPALPEGAAIVLTSTVAPTEAIRLESLLVAQGRGLHLVDAPISGGPSRAATGDLAIMASGDDQALSKAYSVLRALSSSAGRPENLHFIPGGVGFGSKLKAVNQLLAGIHICAAAEATAFARKKGMDLHGVFDIVSKGAAYSYCMKDRLPRMLQKDPAVFSATTTFVKDLGIVLAEAKKANCPVFIAAAAHQQFIRAASAGWAAEDDSSVSRLWEYMGVDVRID